MVTIRYLFYLYLKKDQEAQVPHEKACFCETKSRFAAVLWIMPAPLFEVTLKMLQLLQVICHLSLL